MPSAEDIAVRVEHGAGSGPWTSASAEWTQHASQIAQDIANMETTKNTLSIGLQGETGSALQSKISEWNDASSKLHEQASTLSTVMQNVGDAYTTVDGAIVHSPIIAENREKFHMEVAAAAANMDPMAAARASALEAEYIQMTSQNQSAYSDFKTTITDLKSQVTSNSLKNYIEKDTGGAGGSTQMPAWYGNGSGSGGGYVGFVGSYGMDGRQGGAADYTSDYGGSGGGIDYTIIPQNSEEDTSLWANLSGTGSASNEPFLGRSYYPGGPGFSSQHLPISSGGLGGGFSGFGGNYDPSSFGGEGDFAEFGSMGGFLVPGFGGMGSFGGGGGGTAVGGSSGGLGGPVSPSGGSFGGSTSGSSGSFGSGGASRMMGAGLGGSSGVSGAGASGGTSSAGSTGPGSPFRSSSQGRAFGGVGSESPTNRPATSARSAMGGGVPGAATNRKNKKAHASGEGVKAAGPEDVGSFIEVSASSLVDTEK